MQIKTHSDTTLHLLEWLKLSRLIIPKVGKAMEKLEPSLTAAGSIKWSNHFGKKSGSIFSS